MKILLGASMVLLMSSLSAGDFHIDTSKSYLVSGVVGDTGNVYNRRYYRPVNRTYYKKRHYRKRVAPKKRYIYVPPRMTDNKRIQKALEGLGFYYGRIDGAVNSYATRSAIKKMNKNFGISNSSSLDSRARDNLIFLGTLFILDENLIATGSSTRTKNKRIQAALTVNGFYSDRIDGIKGRSTNKAISDYKRDKGLSYGTSFNYDDEYELIDNAKKTNDANIEDTIAS